MILDEDQRERITFVGPYLEQQPLQLLCRATGGKLSQLSEAAL